VETGVGAGGGSARRKLGSMNAALPLSGRKLLHPLPQTLVGPLEMTLTVLLKDVLHRDGSKTFKVEVTVLVGNRLAQPAARRSERRDDHAASLRCLCPGSAGTQSGAMLDTGPVLRLHSGAQGAAVSWRTDSYTFRPTLEVM